MATVPDDLLPVFDLDLVLVTGKGGVGKSLVSAALAVEAARMGLRPLLVQLGAGASLESLFGVLVEPRPTFVGSGVSALALDVDMALVDYFEAHLPSPRLARALAGNTVLRSLFRAAPGVPELVSLDRLARYLDEREPGRPRWRPIIVDLDASGHARMFFELPRVLDRFTEGGPLEAVVRRVRKMLESPATGVCLVGQGTPLAARETLELYRALVEEHTMLVAGLVVNGVPPPPLPGVRDDAVAALAAWADTDGDPGVTADLSLASRLRHRHAEARAAIDQLRSAVSAPSVELPRLELPTGRAALRRISPLLTGGER